MPLPKWVPPVDAVYHSIVQPAGAVTLNTALLVPQYELLLGFVGFAGLTFTVALLVQPFGAVSVYVLVPDAGVTV